MQITSTQLSDEIWLHAFGMVDGLFISAILYMLFFSLTTLKKAKGRYIALTFFMMALSITFFCLYSIYFQHHNQTITSSVYPSWFITLAKYAAPVALLLISDLFLRNITIESYTDFKLVKLLNTLRYVSVGVSVLAIIILTLVQSSSWALIVIQFMFLINLSLGLYINQDKHNLLQTQFKLNTLYNNAALNGLILLTMFACLGYGVFLYYSDQLLSQMFTLSMVGSYGVVVVLITFGMVRYGFSEIKRHNDLRQTDQHNLTNDLYIAIEENQFFFMFQPKLSLHSQKVSGLESLMRWQHPKMGVVSPQVFIPIAEKVKVLDHLCKLVIEETVKQASDLLEQGYHIPISMNFSGSDMQPKNIDHLEACMTKYNLPAELLMVEVSESLLVELNTDKITALNMLHTLNIPVSLDDYGTGFSSLSYIRSLGIKQLKIDKVFIKNLESHTENQIIVTSTLQMSKGLRISVVAEGVESIQTKRQLESFNCDEIQGYIVSPPLNQHQLYQWLEASPAAKKTAV